MGVVAMAVVMVVKFIAKSPSISPFTVLLPSIEAARRNFSSENQGSLLVLNIVFYKLI
jgi:hypothetical protein